jgi:hypothetical protein
MSIITLNSDNIVNTKVKNHFRIYYKHSDTSTHISDQNVESHSLVNLNRYRDITQEEILESNDTNISAVNRFLMPPSFPWRSIYGPWSGKNILEKKDQLDSAFAGEVVEDSAANKLKNYNFKNIFKVNRVEQSFLPDSLSLQKHKIVFNTLYNDYNSDYSLDYHTNLNFGFCNYNTINFFSQKYNSDKLHSNCIVYPNNLNAGNKNNIDLENNFNISFWINKRKHVDINSGCFLHIPNIVNVYFVESNNKNYRTCITLGNSTKKTLSAANFTNLSLNSTASQSDSSNGVFCLTSADSFEFNKWYNISINFNKTGANYDISIYRNGALLDKFSLEMIKDAPDPYNSYICLGNKPNYFDGSNYNTFYNKTFYTFFGKKIKQNNVEDTFLSPYYNKDINVEEYNEYDVENDHIDLDDFVLFEDVIANNTESFNGEVHDIRIYNDALSRTKIIDILNNSVDYIKDEEHLSFYVPCHYIPAVTRKRGIVNAGSEIINLYYNNYYNPYFASFCGGLDISSENFLIDFVSGNKPNVVIGGSVKESIYSNLYDKRITSMIRETEDVADIKTGVLVKTIFNKNIDSDIRDNVDEVYNINYKNLLILPNDNGIPNIKFNSIEEFSSNFKDSLLIDGSFYKNNNNILYYNISCADILNQSLNYYPETFLDDVSDQIITDSHSTWNLKVADNVFRGYESSGNKTYDLSNFIYHDTRLTNLENVFPDGLTNNNRAYDSFIMNKYRYTKSNPVTRKIKDSTDNIRINNRAIDSTDSIEYRLLPLPYNDINKNYDSLFCNIFEISKQFYNKKLIKSKFNLRDSNIIGSNNNLDISLKDNKYGCLFRNDCDTKVAEWNYVGHVFYKEGFATTTHISLNSFGQSDFELDFYCENNLYVHEVNIPCDAGMFNKSSNVTYNEDLRLDESAFNSEEKFVYISDINIHDENFNVVAKAKLAHPAPKKASDRLLFRLKMDY